MKFRNLVRSLHGSIGLIMGLLFAIVSLTGSSIIFHQEIDLTINRSLHTVVAQTTTMPLENLLVPVRENHPNLSIEYISFPQQPDRSYTIAMTDKNGHRLETFVNPYTGKILGDRVWEYSLVGFLYTLHHELFLGHTGLIILSIVGIAFLGMSLSGMMLWTGWRNRQSRLKIRWNAPKKLLNFDLHQTVGIVSQFLLAILALTGTIIVLLHIFPVFGEDNSVPIPAPNRQPIALSQLVQTADAAMPGGLITNVSFDKERPRKLTVTKHFPEQDTGKFDLSNVQIDRYSGKVLLVHKVIQPDAFFRVIVIIANLHFGTVAGLPSRILYLIAGIAPAILLITGIKMFIDRRWHRVKKIAVTPIDPTGG